MYTILQLHPKSPDVDIELLMMDKNKIYRQMDTAKIKSESILSTQADSPVRVGIDGRNDTQTLLYREVEDNDGNRQLRQDREAEHHLTFTMESGSMAGSYLTHHNLPQKGVTGQLMAQVENGCPTVAEIPFHAVIYYMLEGSGFPTRLRLIHFSLNNVTCYAHFFLLSAGAKVIT